MKHARKYINLISIYSVITSILSRNPSGQAFIKHANFKMKRNTCS